MARSMLLQSFEVHQDLPLSRKEAWDFFSRPENLARITPPDLGFEVTSPVAEQMYAGMIMTYRVRPLAGIAVAWVTEITHVRGTEFFVDEQRIGPYRFWHHQHHFQEIGNGVRMTDLVHYQLPFGWPGVWLFGAIVRRRLEDIFSFRRKTLREMFGALEVDQ